MTSYRDLVAWQKGMDLVVKVYELTRTFPREELFGLTSQVRRSAASIPANIAEGQGRRRGTGEFRQFLYVSRGSLNETETHLEVAIRLGYAPSGVLQAELAERTDSLPGQRLTGDWRLATGNRQLAYNPANGPGTHRIRGG